MEGWSCDLSSLPPHPSPITHLLHCVCEWCTWPGWLNGGSYYLRREEVGSTVSSTYYILYYTILYYTILYYTLIYSGSLLFNYVSMGSTMNTVSDSNKNIRSRYTFVKHKVVLDSVISGK